MPQGVGVVLVGLAGADAVDARADPLPGRVVDAIGIPGVIAAGGEAARPSEWFVALTEGEQSGSGGEECSGGFDEERCAEEIEGVLPDRA